MNLFFANTTNSACSTLLVSCPFYLLHFIAAAVVLNVFSIQHCVVYAGRCMFLFSSIYLYNSSTICLCLNINFSSFFSPVARSLSLFFLSVSRGRRIRYDHSFFPLILHKTIVSIHHHL